MVEKGKSKEKDDKKNFMQENITNLKNMHKLATKPNERWMLEKKKMKSI